jgi:hypothetical protein
VRFARVLLLVLLTAGVFVGVAKALDFNDESEDAPPGEVGRLYHFELHSHGGCTDAPYKYVVESGELPPGLKLTPESFRLPDKRQTGLIDGLPTDSGTWSAWIALKDHCGNSAELLFTFEIRQRTYAITTAALPAANAGATYTTKLAACCHPVRSETWSLSNGTLPAGLSLATDGTISGTPTVPGSSTFTVTATSDGDDGGIRTDSKQLTLAVSGQLTASLSRRNAEVGVPFSANLSVSGVKAPVAWTAKTLPAGLSLSTDGVVSGVPTIAGTATVTARFVDANGAAADVDVPLNVHPRLAIVTKRLASAAVGHAYLAKLKIRGGVPALRWRIVAGHLPRGLKFVASTGTLVGTPTRPGVSRLTVRARDSLGAVAARPLVLTVRP